VDDPGSFFIVERWVSAAALAAHERTPIFNEVGRNILNRYAEFHDALSGVTL
jgi:quinol monooxygenase YgiN